MQPNIWVFLADVFEPPQCGDGYVDIGEECDDDNQADDDGCDSHCRHRLKRPESRSLR